LLFLKTYESSVRNETIIFHSDLLYIKACIEYSNLLAKSESKKIQIVKSLQEPDDEKDINHSPPLCDRYPVPCPDHSLGNDYNMHYERVIAGGFIQTRKMVLLK